MCFHYLTGQNLLSFRSKPHFSGFSQKPCFPGFRSKSPFICSKTLLFGPRVDSFSTTLLFGPGFWTENHRKHRKTVVFEGFHFSSFSELRRARCFGRLLGQKMGQKMTTFLTTFLLLFMKKRENLTFRHFLENRFDSFVVRNVKKRCFYAFSDT